MSPDLKHVSHTFPYKVVRVEEMGIFLCVVEVPFYLGISPLDIISHRASPALWPKWYAGQREFRRDGASPGISFLDLQGLAKSNPL